MCARVHAMGMGSLRWGTFAPRRRVGTDESALSSAEWCGGGDGDDGDDAANYQQSTVSIHRVRLLCLVEVLSFSEFTFRKFFCFFFFDIERFVVLLSCQSTKYI